MTQNDLNRAIARATGETVTEISHLGFQPLNLEPVDAEDRFIDWDALQLERNIAVFEQRAGEECCAA